MQHDLAENHYCLYLECFIKIMQEFESKAFLLGSFYTHSWLTLDQPFFSIIFNYYWLKLDQPFSS
jgi:hypothetical protein